MLLAAKVVRSLVLVGCDLPLDLSRPKNKRNVKQCSFGLVKKMIGTRTGLLRANVLRVFGFLGGGLCLGVMLGCKSSSSHASHEADSAVFALSRDPLKGRELSTV